MVKVKEENDVYSLVRRSSERGFCFNGQVIHRVRRISQNLIINRVRVLGSGLHTPTGPIFLGVPPALHETFAGALILRIVFFFRFFFLVCRGTIFFAILKAFFLQSTLSIFVTFRKSRLI